MVRAFLTSGLAAAASAFIPGARGVALLSMLLAFYGEDAGASVGLTASYFGIALAGTAGLGVTAVFRLSRRTSTSLGSVAEDLERLFRAAAAATVVLVVITVAAGIVVPLIVPVDATLFNAYWFGYSLSVIVLPFAATLTGVFQARNRDTENLLLAIAGAVVHLGVTYVSSSTGQPALTTVLVAALVGSASDLLAVMWRTVFLAPDRALGSRSIARGVMLFIRRPVAGLRELPASLTGALDGLILMTVFTVAATIAARTSVADGAIVVLVVATLRAVIVPLKQFGMAGGRIIVQRRALGVPDNRQLRKLVATSAVILWSIAALILLIKVTTPLLDMLPWPIAGLMAAQLVLEPVTGVAFAAQKILDRPAFGLSALMIVSVAGTIPVLLMLSALGVATALWVWSAVFSARVLFFLYLVARMRFGQSTLERESTHV